MHGKYASSLACKNADLIIGIGVRFSDRATGNAEKFAKGAKIIQLDADLAEINKNVPVEVGVVGELRDALLRISAQCRGNRLPEWKQQVDAFAAKQRDIEAQADKAAGEMAPKKLMESINAQKQADTIIATDVGQHQMWAAQYIDLKKPRHFLTSGGLGTMGYGLGAAIGASVGTGRKVLLVTGDGSFGMNLPELATVETYHLPVVIVIFNNGVLGMVRQWQTLFCEGRHSQTVLNRKTDFIKVAEAFGVRAGRAASRSEFEALLKEAMAADEPFVIEVPIDKDEIVLPMIASDGSLDDIITADPRRETP